MEIIISLLIFGAITTGTIIQSEQNETPPNQTVQSSVEEEFLFISLERTPCLGRCPSYRISIYNTGRVLYEGYTFVDQEGNYATQLDQGEMDRLKKVMQEINVFALEDKYDSYKTDIPSCILHLNDGEQSKKIYDRDGAPEALINFEKLIDRLVLSKELKKLKKSE